MRFLGVEVGGRREEMRNEWEMVEKRFGRWRRRFSDDDDVGCWWWDEG